MKVYVLPQFKRDDQGEGGIRRVVEAQMKYLPDFGVEFVDVPSHADLVNLHAGAFVEHSTIVASCHGLYWTGHHDYPAWAWKTNANVIHSILRAKETIVPSEWVAKSIRRGALIDSHVIPHGLDLELWDPLPPDDYVLWNKNRKTEICDPSPINFLASRLPGQQFVSTYGNKDLSNLRVTGTVAFSYMNELVRRSQVYLATTKETFGIGMIEAMAAGVPVLAFDWGGAKDIVLHKETGYLVPPDSYEALIEGLDYCLRNREWLGENARQRVVEQYQWHQVIGKYYEVFQQALNHRHVGPKVSVVITAYNLDQYLPAAVESIIGQTFVDWELIIVDDCSPDKTPVIAQGYADAHENIHYVRNPVNLNVAESRNKGIRLARGEYVICLDCDDTLEPTALALLSRALDNDPDLDIVTGAMRFYKEGYPETDQISGWPPDTIDYHQQIQGKNQLPYASMFRRSVWKRVGGYRRRLDSVEDADFWTRTMSYGAHAAKVTGKPTLRYVIRSQSKSNAIQQPEWHHWYLWAFRPEFTPFTAVGEPPNSRPSWPVYAYDNPLVSVIVPVGPAHENFLQDAVDSIVAQTLTQWELILVNDTGRRWLDDEGNRINPHIQGMPFAKIVDIEEENISHCPAWTRNRGLREASAPYIAFLDADDFAQPLWLEIMVEVVEKEGGWAYCDYYLDIYGTDPQSAEDWDAAKARIKMLGPNTVVFRQEDIRAVGGFDEALEGWEDFEILVALLARGVCGNHVAHPLITYRFNTGTRRERSYDAGHALKQYIQTKHERLYQDREFFMGCKTCGGGGGKKRVTLKKSVVRGNIVNQPEADKVLVEYVGPSTQKQRLRSKYNRRAHYIFSGPPGTETRRFYAYKEDAGWLSAMADFRVIPDTSRSVVSAREETPTLYATSTPTKTEVRISILDQYQVPQEVITLLERAGYEYVGQLVGASDAELLVIKGIGPARLETIREALDRFVR